MKPLNICINTKEEYKSMEYNLHKGGDGENICNTCI